MYPQMTMKETNKKSYILYLNRILILLAYMIFSMQTYRAVYMIHRDDHTKADHLFFSMKNQ